MGIRAGYTGTKSFISNVRLWIVKNVKILLNLNKTHLRQETVYFHTISSVFFGCCIFTKLLILAILDRSSPVPSLDPALDFFENIRTVEDIYGFLELEPTVITAVLFEIRMVNTVCKRNG